jgi:hypothetical protein
MLARFQFQMFVRSATCEAIAQATLSPSYADTIFVSPEGHARENRRAAGWLRRDGKFAFHQVDSLAHTDEPQTPPAKGMLLVKANAVVANSKVNLRRGPFEPHSEVPHTAVLDCILQGFL